MPLMRIRPIVVALLGAVSMLATPALAAADVPASKLLRVQQGSPMALVSSNSTIPLHFTISAGQAIRVAESSPTLQALHSRVHPLDVFPYVWRSEHPYWYVVFLHRGK